MLALAELHSYTAAENQTRTSRAERGRIKDDSQLMSLFHTTLYKHERPPAKIIAIQ